MFAHKSSQFLSKILIEGVITEGKEQWTTERPEWYEDLIHLGLQQQNEKIFWKKKRFKEDRRRFAERKDNKRGLTW